MLENKIKEIAGKKEQLNNKEIEARRRYVKPARKHHKTAQATLEYVHTKVQKAKHKMESAIDAVDIAWGLSFFGCGLGLPMFPFVYLNKWAKRNTRAEYLAIYSYKLFMARKDSEVTKLNNEIVEVEALMRELNTETTLVETTVTNTVQTEDENVSVMVPRKP